MKTFLKFFIAFVGAVLVLHAQSVYLPVTHPLYRFLDRLEAQGIVTNYRDAVKPLTRSALAAYIIEADTTSLPMTEVDREQLSFFKEELYQELHALGYENLVEERWHLFQYESAPALVNIDLIGGYTNHGRGDGTRTTVTSNGAMAYGYAGNSIGAYFYFKDNHEAGSYLDPLRPLSPIPAEVPSRDLRPRYFEYTTIEAQVNVDFGFVTLSAEKMPNQWGTGDRGTIILSNKAPSFPQLKIRAHLGKSVDFTYLHGWLYSGVLDSLRSYYVAGLPRTGTFFRRVYEPKYIAAHMLEVTPWNGVDLSIGESEIYGGRNPELLYLIPVMFFKGAEHYMGDTDNSQFFLNADLNVVNGYAFYLSLFLDEFSTEDFYRTDKQRNQLAFTVGTRAYDTFAPNTEFLIEYTRLNPWVYNHKFPDATFQNHSVDLGHWLGQNADMFFCRFSYQPTRALEAGIQFESLRKGGKKSTQFQYLLPTPEFLYGPLMKSQSFGVTGRYEPLRDLVIDASVLRSQFTDQAAGGANDFAGKWDLFFGIRYNIE